MTRAISPAVGIVLLTLCVLALGAAVSTMTLAYEPFEPASSVVVTGVIDAETNEITLVLDRGGPLDVREISILVEIDGQPLEEQPPVPFHQVEGFYGFPTGPFNASADPIWDRGRSAGFRIAKTNGPLPESGSRVRIRLFERGLPIATVETVAE